MEVTVCRALPPTPVQPGCFWPSCPNLGLTMSPGQVLGVHQADLFLPRDVTVQSDGEVVRRQKHLLRWQLHSACADPEGTPVLAARLMVSRKSVCQHQEAAAPASPLLSLSPLPLSQVGLNPQPHLVKRSQGLEPWPSSGVDQWQSILRMLLVRQVKVPGPSPGNSDVGSPRWLLQGRAWGGGRGSDS